MDKALAKRSINRPADRFGRAVSAVPDPWKMTRRQVPDKLRDRDPLNNTHSNITPQNIKSIFDRAGDGYIGSQVELAQDIEERDPHIQSTMQTRINAVLALDYILTPGDDTPEATAACDEFNDIWDHLDTRGLMEDLLAAILQQWAVSRIVWNCGDKNKDGDRRWTPTAFEQTDARRLVWPIHENKTDDPEDISVTVPALSIDWTQTNTERLTPGVYITHSYRDKRARPGHGAIVRALAWWWMVKHYAAIDWATFCEQFGIPWRVVKYDPSMTEEQTRDMLGALREAASNLAIAVPANAELSLVEGMKGGEPPHAALIRVADEQISKVIVGSTTISDAAASNDSVSSPTHSDVRRVIRDKDARSLCETISRDLIRIWSYWNFGPNVASPILVPDLASKPNPSSRLAIFQGVSTFKLKVKTDQLYSDLGLEKPKGLEDVIELSAVDPAQAGFGFGSMPGSGMDLTQSRQDAEKKPETDGTVEGVTDA